MTKEELYNKIDKFCNETDWSKYLTYEHALEEFIKEIVEEETKHLKEEIAQLEAQIEQLVYLHNEDVNTIKLLNKQIEKNAELKKEKGCETCTKFDEVQLTKAKEILKSLYFIIESRIDYKNNIEIADEMWRAEQFWKVEK